MKSKKEDDSDIDEIILRPNEIYYYNFFLLFDGLIILCLTAIIMPEGFIKNLFGLNVFPQKYWFVAVPTHILTTLLGLTICIKGFELIQTIDNPPINDIFYHELSEEEMMKEINYSPSEGILPDAGDINFEIVQTVRNMSKN